MFYGRSPMFYGRFGRFPRGRSELHDDAVEFVARQLGVSAGSVGFMAGARIRAEERRYERVRDKLLAEYRSRSIEPPTPDQVERIVRSGLHQAEKILTARTWARLPGPYPG